MPKKKLAIKAGLSKPSDPTVLSSLKRNNKQDNTKTKVKKHTSNVLLLSSKSLATLFKNWLPFSVISAIYFFLTLLFVRGFSSTINVTQLKDTYFGAHKPSVVSASMSVFVNLLSNSSSSPSGSSNPSSSDVYQTILFVVFSLVFIWMLREAAKTNKITVRESLYKSQFALIPFLIVSFIIILETIPMFIGFYLYSTVFSGGIAVETYEKIIWLMVCFGFILLSLYLLISSIFAIFVVTLPDTRPMQALRTAWRLVKGRRVSVLGKILFLPIGLLVMIGIASIVFVLLLPQIADFVFFALGVISLPVVLSYLYNLYRELI